MEQPRRQTESVLGARPIETRVIDLTSSGDLSVLVVSWGGEVDAGLETSLSFLGEISIMRAVPSGGEHEHAK